MPNFVIRPADASDLPTAVAWLQGEGLPIADLTSAHMQDFLVALQDGTPIGMIGLEAHADCGLLRSLYVAKDSRSTGAGARLITALEAKAKEHQMQQLWLLTIDADTFFLRHGYAVMPRAAAPAAIQTSAEFSSLCPGDAVLMRKQLVAA